MTSREDSRREAWSVMAGAIGAVAAVLVLWAMVTLGSAASSSPPLKPDPQLTPGATLEVTTSDICVPGYTKNVRAVPAAIKRQVYAAYGIQDHAPGAYEVDHLIPLELGGSNALKKVCSGQLALDTAQQEIATDWMAAYQKYFHTELPLTQARTRPHTRRPEERP